MSESKIQNVPIHPSFIWQGTNSKGHNVSGEIRAANIHAVRANLRVQSITPTKIRRKAKAVASFSLGKSIKAVEISNFTRMLATMVSAGVPLMQSVQLIGEAHEHPGMKEMILSIKSDVESGSSLFEALSKYPYYFDELYTSLINAGEQSGTLEVLLDEIATFKERTEQLKSKVRKALVYPSIILAVAFIVTGILMIFVVPQFSDLFINFGADLPALTRMIIDLSEFLQKRWWLVGLILIAPVVMLIQARKRSVKIKRIIDRLLLKVPVLGVVLVDASIARFARTSATMFKAGVPMVEALESVAGATGNAVYYDATMTIRDEISSGTQLNVAMQNTELFPGIVTQMVVIGEESGSLEAMLSKISEYFESKVAESVDNLTALLEPAIMVFLGVIVGTLVVAMYLPIFKMGSVL